MPATNKNDIKIPTNSPVQSLIFEVIKLMYQHHDPTNMPIELESMKNMAQITYETASWDPCTPVKATLHLEKTPEQGRKMHFNIDLLYPCICDQVTRKQYRTPPSLLPLLKEVKIYVNETLKFRRASRETGYYRRLLNKGLLSREDFHSYRKKESNLLWSGTCPVCFDYANGVGFELMACVICGTLGCARIGCRGHDINGILQSLNNPGETYCRSCNGYGENARLVPCTTCHKRWFNPRCHPRCVGRPGLLIVINLPSGIGGRIWPSRKKAYRIPYPQHPVMIAPCGECWERNDGDWLSCANPTCWSPYGVVCKACSPDGGLKCAGGHKWFCDECVSHLPSLKCCYNHERGNERQVERDTETILGPRGYLKLRECPDDSLDSRRLQIFS